MMRFSRTIVLLAAFCLLLLPASWGQATAVSSQQQLIKDVAYNELQDRERDSFWAYDIDQKIGHDSYAKRQVETKQGPIFRILEENGKPLTDAESAQRTGPFRAFAQQSHRPCQKPRRTHAG